MSEEMLAKIIRDEEGNYHVVDQDGTEGPSCKLVDDDDKTIALTKNASNRQWYNRKKADEAIDTQGFCPLYYKASVKFGPQGTKTPNAKLIAYLPEDLQAEYNAIIERAREAMAADKKKPMTELEKAQAALEKAQAKLDALRAQTTETN